VRHLQQLNTYAWFKEHTYYVAERPAYDASSRSHAFDVLMNDSEIPLGVLYRDGRAPFEELVRLPRMPLAELDLGAERAALGALQSVYE